MSGGIILPAFSPCSVVFGCLLAETNFCKTLLDHPTIPRSKWSARLDVAVPFPIGNPFCLSQRFSPTGFNPNASDLHCYHRSFCARIRVKTYSFSSILWLKITLTSRRSRDMRAQLHHLSAELGLAAISIGKSYADWREPGRAFQRKVASGWLFPSSDSSRLEGIPSCQSPGTERNVSPSRFANRSRRPDQAVGLDVKAVHQPYRNRPRKCVATGYRSCRHR